MLYSIFNQIRVYARKRSMASYENYTKEELIQLVKTLETHNTQLKNIIQKNDFKTTLKKSQRPFNFNNCKVRHVFLKFLYLGWNYNGYVTQEDTVNTIEHEIFKALQKTCLIEERSKSNYHRCGRTDKGVSSFSQVISLDVRSKSSDVKEEFNYCKMLNSVLPQNIQFYAWAPVEQEISARFNCISRTYKYYFPKGNLDVDTMRNGAHFLEGSHDFRNFCKMDVNNGVVAFVRTIKSVEIKNLEGTSENVGDAIYVLIITGNAFLWHQIRCIVAVLILIGQHKENPDIILKLLDVNSNPRKPDYQMASELPLNLYDCSYDNVNWIYDKDNLKIVIKNLRENWTFSTIKSSMVRDMTKELETEIGEEYQELGDFLLPGVKSRTYQPLMKRQLCDSLEQKIEHSKKRKRNKVPLPE